MFRFQIMTISPLTLVMILHLAKGCSASVEDGAYLHNSIGHDYEQNEGSISLANIHDYWDYSQRLQDIGDSSAENTQENDTCELELCKICVGMFRHVVHYRQASFVHLKLTSDNMTHLKSERNVISENQWVWTFYGKEGGFEFLKWPSEYGIWSLRLLSSYTVSTPLNIKLIRVKGNCSNLVVGKKSSDEVISKALLNLTLTLMSYSREDNVTYAPSFFCYRKRNLFVSDFVYKLCINIICPVDPLKYVCCSYSYRAREMTRKLVCKGAELSYDSLWWTLSTVPAFFLFAFSPLIIMFVCNQFPNSKRCSVACISANRTGLMCKNSCIDRNIVLLDGNQPVTFLGTILAPLTTFTKVLKSDHPGFYKYVFVKVCRCFYPLISLTFIGIQILLDHQYLSWYIYNVIDIGIPMGFRSMIAGYERSKDKFLPFLGGPYIALGLYLLVTCFLLVIPESLSEFLVSGLQTSWVDESKTPLRLSIKTIETFGRVRIRFVQGYSKLFKVFLGQFYMLTNTEFWKYVVGIQKSRLLIWFQGQRGCLCLFLPFYILICLLEIFLCILEYGFPILSFGLIIIKAFYRRRSDKTSNTVFGLFLGIIIGIFLTACVLFFLFMFCTIFLDATLFITRITIFTFTGIVMYPKVSYGILILVLTIIYYFWDSMQDFAKIYRSLLKDIILICESIQTEQERLVVKIGDYKGIKQHLFEFVIERHQPRRHQVVKSVIRMGIVILGLVLAIRLLIEMDGLRELHVVMHVGTALFVCALPQIVKSMCAGKGERFKRKLFRKEIAATIKRYTSYFDGDGQCQNELEELSD